MTKYVNDSLFFTSDRILDDLRELLSNFHNLILSYKKETDKRHD